MQRASKGTNPGQIPCPQRRSTVSQKTERWPADALSNAPTLDVCLSATQLEKKNMNDSETAKYPLLEAILAIQNLPLQPMYTNKDISAIFKVCVRAIQNWISAGRLTPRDLPGRWKFFPQDLEDFLQKSTRERRAEA